MADTARDKNPSGASENGGFEVEEWKDYLGNLPIKFDGLSNRGACEGLLASLSKSENKDKTLNALAVKKWSTGEYARRMTLDNLKVEGWVGNGAFGIVWRAKLSGGQDVAVKQINIQKSSIESVWKERDILIYLKATGPRRVSNLVGAFFEDDAFLVLELCVSSVSDAIGLMSKKDRNRFMIQLLQAVAFIHSKGIWHCDIRPDNLLITTCNNLVLADFGKAIYAPGKDKVSCKSDLGVYYYCDFEANCKGMYSSKTDVWAAGCSLYEFSTGKCLMRYGKLLDVSKYEYGQVALLGKQNNYSKDNPDTKRTILEEKYKPTPFARVLRQMITPTWDTRMEAAAILNDRVFAGLCRHLEVNIASVENDASDIITIEPLKRAPPPSFKILSAVDSSGAQAVNLCGIYYDELEQIGSQDEAPPLYRPLASQSGAEFVRCLKQQGVLEDFVKGVYANDPICFASCAYVAEKSLGLMRQVASTSNEVRTVISDNLKEPVVGGGKPLAEAAVSKGSIDMTVPQSQKPDLDSKIAESHSATGQTVVLLNEKPNEGLLCTNIREPDANLSLDMFGTVVNADGNVSSTFEQPLTLGKQQDTDDQFFAQPKSFAEPMSTVGAPTKPTVCTSSSPLDTRTYHSLTMAPDGQVTFSLPVTTTTEIAKDRKPKESAEEKGNNLDGRDKTFRVPKGRFSPRSSSTIPLGSPLLRKPPTKRSLSPGRPAPSSSQAAIPTSRPTLPKSPPRRSTRGNQRGRGRGSLVRGIGRRGGSRACNRRSKSPDEANGNKKTTVGDADRPGGLLHHDGDSRKNFGAADGNDGSPDDSDDGLSDGGAGGIRRPSSIACRETTQVDSTSRHGESGAVHGRSRLPNVGAVNRGGKIKSPKNSELNINDHRELRQTPGSMEIPGNLQGAKTTRGRTNPNSESNRRSDEIDPGKQEPKPSTSFESNRRSNEIDPKKKSKFSFSMKLSPTKNKDKGADTTKPTGSVPASSSSKKRSHTGKLDDGCGAVKKQHMDESVEKKKAAGTKQCENKNLGSATTQRPLQYKCTNHGRGCKYRGDKESVVTHMEDCELNSSDDESSDSSSE